MRFLALTLLLSFSFAGFSGNKDGGNGQLVVIPQGETDQPDVFVPFTMLTPNTQVI